MLEKLFGRRHEAVEKKNVDKDIEKESETLLARVKELYGHMDEIEKMTPKNKEKYNDRIEKLKGKYDKLVKDFDYWGIIGGSAVIGSLMTGPAAQYAFNVPIDWSMLATNGPQYLSYAALLWGIARIYAFLDKWSREDKIAHNLAK